MRAIGSGVIVAAMCIGCADGGTARGAATVRDSAGVQIVENKVGAWETATPWRVTTSAQLKIGNVEGAEVYRFYRIASGTRLSDGSLVVGDAGSGQVRLFGSDGVHIRTFGTQGDGPGEFRSIRWLRVRGDSVMIFDDQSERVTTYRLTGGLVRTWSVLMGADPRPMALGDLRILDGGQVFGMDGMNLAPGSPPSIARDTAFIFEIRADASTSVSVAAVPGSWTQYLEIDGRSVYRHQPLTTQPSWDSNGDAILVTSGDSFEYREYSRTGELARLVRRAEVAAPVTAADERAWKDLLLGAVPETQRPMVAPTLDGFTMPAALPVYSRLLVDRQGAAWLGRFSSPGVDPVSVWDVFDRDGLYLGALQTPEGLKVMEIGADYVLGTWTDELNVEYVQVHALDRGGTE